MNAEKTVTKRSNRFKDLSGRTFGRLKVLRHAEDYVTPKGAKYPRCVCACECGTKKEIIVYQLVSGKVVSCGCYGKAVRLTAALKHGRSRSRIYKIWQAIHQRCRNPNIPRYKHYGKRGINVCERWNQFENFFEDMGETYSDDLTIDRIDNDGNYCKENCRWSNYEQQANNTSRTIYLEFENKRKALSVWCRERHMNYAAVLWRIKNGWSATDALTTPFNSDLSPKHNEPAPRQA